MGEFTYELDTNIGQVRLKIQDKTASGRLFDDEEIQVALNDAGGDTDLAAARCLRWVAANKALTAKAMKIGNWAEDTKGVPDALIKAAETFEKAAAGTPASAFASQDVSDFQYRERIEKESVTPEVES